MHLLLPLLASILLICGLIFIKRAGEAGAGTITTLFFSNVASAAFFSLMWLLGGTMQPMSSLWQPALVAVLFCLGLVFTFLSVERGDVSIATPVLGVKVIFVAVILNVFVKQEVTAQVWIAAFLATAGIAIIQWTGQFDSRRAVFTIAFAILAAMSFATFDVVVQQCAPAWGPGRFLPITYWIVAAISLTMIPWVDFRSLQTNRRQRYLLAAGAVLIGLQAICIVFALAKFGDAARVNVVYGLRGLWGVALAWVAAKIWGGAEASIKPSQMFIRGTGAVLLTLAVTLVILA